MAPPSEVAPEVRATGDVLGVVGDAAWGVPPEGDVPAADAACVEASADVGVAAGGADAVVDLPAAEARGARIDFVPNDAFTDEVEGVDALADVPARVGRGTVDAPNDAPGAVDAPAPPAVGAAADAPPRVRALAADAPNDAAGAVDVPNDAPAAVGAAALDDPPARTALAAPAVAAFAAGEAALGATPTGLEIFLAAAPEESEVDVPRGAALAGPGGLEELAPIETPTGRVALTWVVPDGEDAIPCF
jgi:hypothetical protein